MDRGAWWATIHGVAKSRTTLSVHMCVRTHTHTYLQIWKMRHREVNGNPLQCYCLENPRDGGAWWAAVYGVAQS